MNMQKIALKYKNSVILMPTDTSEVKPENLELVATIAASMMSLGFMASEELYTELRYCTHNELEEFYGKINPELENIKGADVNYTPMYPNFPQQVMEADEVELFINAIVHYWSNGVIMPDYETLPREVLTEKGKYQEIGVITDTKTFSKIFTDILASNESISVTDKDTIKWFFDNNTSGIINFDDIKEIPFKENMCYVVGLLFEREMTEYLSQFVKTATDVLRVMAHLSGGDVSLTERTKFKSLPRPQRRVLVKVLENVIREEDIARRRGVWTRAFHNLHVGDYSNKVFNIAAKIRNNQHIETFAGKVEMALSERDVLTAISLLETRPGEFSRRIEHLLRLNRNHEQTVVNHFLEVVDKVPTRVLFQVRGSLKNRMEVTDKRIVFPKGNVQKAIVVRKEVPSLPHGLLKSLVVGIDRVLTERFSVLEPMGNVWIDPELKKCPLPTQQRSASEGAFQVARGTRLPIGDKKTLRFFIYWIGSDIDLSATFHNEEFGYIKHISYTNLRSSTYNAAHSGDVTNAPKGGSEFIDIDIDSAVNNNTRYIAMNVLVYTGPTFAEHEKVYAGWMTRDCVESGEIYEPKTVEQKIDLTAKSKNVIPVIFDLVERKAIWCDLSTPKRIDWYGNNIESNFASIQETMEAISSLKKSNLYELFKLHAEARGNIVEDKDDADVVFSTYEGITPYDITTINSEFVV